MWEPDQYKEPYLHNLSPGQYIGQIGFAGFS